MPQRIHFLGICGRMVGGLAMALKGLGVRVSGTEVNAFPPMPDILRDAGIQIQTSWSADHLTEEVEAVVTGSLLSRAGNGNPELEAALDRGLPVWNSTAFLEEYFLRDSSNLVVAGTKGKTTTTAMLTWILEAAGFGPDYLIGGQVRGGHPRLRFAGAPLAVLEGDEYRCGLGDPSPKFLRYHPSNLVVTNIAHDHHEIFPTPEQYFEAFVHLVNQVPGNGTLTLNADDPGSMALAGRTPTPVHTVGFSRKSGSRITAFQKSSAGTGFKLEGVPFALRLHGRTDVTDAALAAVAARHLGVSLKKSARVLKSFPGIEGRLEMLAASGNTVIYSDEAYLPLALGPLLETVRRRHPRRRVVLVFEPRYTGGREGWAQKELAGCLAKADLVLAAPAIELKYFKEPFDHRRLCRDLRKLGTEAVPLPRVEDAAMQARRLWKEGDVVVLSLSLIRGGVMQEVVKNLQQIARGS